MVREKLADASFSGLDFAAEIDYFLVIVKEFVVDPIDQSVLTYYLESVKQKGVEVVAVDYSRLSVVQILQDLLFAILVVVVQEDKFKLHQLVVR